MGRVDWMGECDRHDQAIADALGLPARVRGMHRCPQRFMSLVILTIVIKELPEERLMAQNRVRPARSLKFRQQLQVFSKLKPIISLY